MKLRLFKLVLPVVLLSILVTPIINIWLLNAPASAADTTQTLTARGLINPACTDLRALHGQDTVDKCATYFVKGYQNPSKPSTCVKILDANTQAACNAGYPAGQQAYQADHSSSTTQPQQGTPSNTQIKSLALANSTCKSLDSGSAEQADCVTGYIGGFNGADEDKTCAHPKVSAKRCSEGYQAALEDTGKATPASQSTDGDVNTDLSLGCNLGIKLSVSGIINAINPLNYIFCGMTKALVQMVNTLDDFITSQLAVGTGGDSGDPNQIFADSNGNCAKNGACDDYYSAWKTFRNIALGLVVIAGLVIVISQALGLEILDAYTIRKTLPRVLVATVAITLSWPLMRFAVELSNDLGFGIRRLIYAPFIGFNSELHLSLAQSGALTILAGIGGYFAGFLGLMTLAGTAALALLVAFIVLILRQIAIIMLIVFAPIAIVAYVLPNTQKYYKFWWESFSKALLMFPLIVAFIAIGRVFSQVALKQGDGLLSQMIAFVAYFAPYFAIAFTFRFAGGVLSQLGGFVNDRSRGGFDRLRKIRGQQLDRRTQAFGQKFKTGDFSTIVPRRFNRLNRANQKYIDTLNTLGRRSTAGIRGGFGFGARGLTAAEADLMQAGEAAGQEQGMKDNASINGFNRLMVFMAKHHGDEAAAMENLRAWYSDDKNEYNRKFEGQELRDKLADARARLANVGGYTPGRAVASYLAMGQDGTAIRDVEDSAEIAALVSEGSGNTAYNLMSMVGSVSKQRGRLELQPSQDRRAEVIGAMVAKTKGESVANFDSILDRATMSGAGGESSYNILMNAPSRVIRGNVEHAMDIIRRYKTDPTSVPLDDAAQAAAVLQDLQAGVAAGYGKPDNKIAFQQAMHAEGRGELLNEFLSDSVNLQTVTDDFGNVTVRTQPARTTGVTDYRGNASRSDISGNATPRDQSVAEYVQGFAGGGGPQSMSQEQRQAMIAQQQQAQQEQQNQQNQQQR